MKVVNNNEMRNVNGGAVKYCKTCGYAYTNPISYAWHLAFWSYHQVAAKKK